MSEQGTGGERPGWPEGAPAYPGQSDGRPGPPAPGQPAGWGAPPPPHYAAPPPAYAPPPPAHRKPPLPPFPHPEPREYHQMLLTWNYAWWKPVLGTVLVVLGMFTLPALLLPVLLAGAALEPGSLQENFEEAANLEAVGPMTMLWLNLSLGGAILLCALVMRLLHRMRLRWLTSVVPKMRWKLFFIFVGISVVALVAQLAVGWLISDASSAPTAEVARANDLSMETALLALVILLTTPLQAAGEEYLFRGYLTQAVGSFWSFSWVRPWVVKALAIVLPAVVFALAHGSQSFPLFFDRFMFGLIAGWLVIRTGGLEVGIAMHILNNFLALGYALLFSDLASALQPSGVGWENIPVTLTQAGTFALLVILVVRKLDVQRRTRPPADTPRDGLPAAPDPHWSRS